MEFKIIDITHQIYEHMDVYPGDPQPIISVQSNIDDSGYKSSIVCIGSHIGTHIDAPSHVLKNGKTIGDIELHDLFGDAVLIDLSNTNKNTITSEILHKKIKQINYSATPKILLIKKHTNTKTLRFKEEALKWIVDNGFKVVGTSCMSIEASSMLEAHLVLLSKDVYIIENLNLDSVYEGLFYFIALPLNITKCDGAPIRAILISSELNSIG
ncbi:cyclase family protein [Methanosalsum natronophilum]|nr:cyclase family protein [Methanosalsum natronophilum]MCS3923039.1 arylformamidase [Methanosalsum natronophilum]